MTKKKSPTVNVNTAEVAQVAKWIVTGASADDVAESIRVNFPESNVAALMLAAMERFRETANFDPSIVLGFVFEGVREIYRKCSETGDYGTALRALKQLEGMAKYVRNQDGTNAAEGNEREVESVDDDGPNHLPITRQA